MLTEKSISSKEYLISAEKGDLRTAFLYLSQNDCNKNLVNLNMQSVLHIALLNDQDDFINFIINREIESKVIDDEERPLLKKDYDLDLSIQDINRDTALHIALKRKNEKIFHVMLNYLEINDSLDILLLRNSSGFCVLSLASERGLLGVVSRILTISNRQYNRRYIGMGPLHWSIKRHHNNCFKELMNYNPELWAQNKLGDTPLHVAIASFNFKAVGMLMSYIVSNKLYGLLTIQNNLGETPLLLAAKLKILEFVEILLPYSNLDQQDTYGKCVLHHLIEATFTNSFHSNIWGKVIYNIDNNKLLDAIVIIDKVLNKNPNTINIRDKHGSTPVMYAVKIGVTDILEKLMTYKPMLDIKDKYDKTALDYAKECDNKSCIDMLLSEIKANNNFLKLSI